MQPISYASRYWCGWGVHRLPGCWFLFPSRLLYCWSVFGLVLTSSLAPFYFSTPFKLVFDTGLTLTRYSSCGFGSQCPSHSHEKEINPGRWPVWSDYVWVQLIDHFHLPLRLRQCSYRQLLESWWRSLALGSFSLLFSVLCAILQFFLRFFSLLRRSDSWDSFRT